MAMKLTEEQQKAVDLRNSNVLVSAAAGSGKTGVLTERVLSLLEDDIDIDRLLILTFTNAAAGEMRKRIRGKLFEKIKNGTGDERKKYSRQMNLLAEAHITTIHSFCKSVISDHYQFIPGLDPKFMMLDAKKAEILRGDLMKDFLEQCYEYPDLERRKGFEDLVYYLGTGLSDEGVGEEIIRLLNFAEAQGDPEIWIKEALKKYGDFDFVQNSLNEYGAKLFDTVIGGLENALTYNNHYGGPESYERALAGDIAEMEAARDEVLHGGVAPEKPFGRFPSVKGDDKTAVSLYVKGRRDDLKEYYTKKILPVFSGPFKDRAELLGKTYPLLDNLAFFALEFYRQYEELKLKKRSLDFGDLEIYALRILRENEDIRKAYQNSFAEIMVDEYQDVNPLQEQLLELVAKENNLFVVGDVKQSIYGFRFADPALFLTRSETYDIKSEAGELVVLNKNFRSRRSVLETTNFFFKEWLRKDCGGLDYGEREALYCGASYPEKDKDYAELLFITAPDSGDFVDGDNSELEARYIAQRINDMVSSGQLVGQGDNLHQLDYGDIAILVRSPGSVAQTICEVLGDAGIPVNYPENDLLGNHQEVRLLMCLLGVLDNPLQDIPLGGVLRSPIFGFNEDELFLLARRKKNMHLWERLKAEYLPSEIKEKAALAYNTILKWRGLTPLYSVSDLLDILLKETDYISFWSGLPNGRQRVNRIEKIKDYAKSFTREQGGLFDFLRYMAKINESPEQDNTGGTDNSSVTLMSIHKSKGLEFPVVFVSYLAKKRDPQKESTYKIFYHQDLGFGPQYIDRDLHYKVPTVMRSLIECKNKEKAFEEDLRLIYVAMTRAREKLILTAFCDEEKITSYLEKIAPDEQEIPADLMKKATTFLHWFCYGLGRYVKPFAPYEWVIGEPPPLKVAKVETPLTPLFAKAKEGEARLGDMALERLKEAVSFTAPKKFNTKTSVTALLDYEAYETAVVPLFLKEAGATNPALSGNAFHLVMENIDFSTEYDERALEDLKKSLVEERHLRDDYLTVVDNEAIIAFLNSPYGRELQTSKDIRRELPFTALFTAQELYGVEDTSDILLQGAIDLLYLRDDGTWVLIDYKTGSNHGSDEKFLAYYGDQLKWYSEAVKRLFGFEISTKAFYLSREGRFINADSCD